MVDIKKIFLTNEAGLRNTFDSLKEDATIDELKELHEKCVKVIKTMKSVVKKQKIPAGPKASIEVIVHRVSEIAYRVKWKIANYDSQNGSEKTLEVTEIESLFANRLRTGIIVNDVFIDVKKFLEECKSGVFKYINNAIQDFKFLKASLTLTGVFQLKEKFEDKFFSLKYEELTGTSDLDKWFETKVVQKFLTDIEEFSTCESGWSLSQIKNLVIQITKFNPIRAGSWIDTPKWLKDRKAVINVKNSFDDCFATAIMSGMFPTDGNSDRISSYPTYHNFLNFNNISFPVSLKDVVKFEKQNDVSVNVFIIEHEEILPVHVTKNEKENHINLLMLIKHYEDEILHHFCWIKNLSRLLVDQVGAHNGTKYFCNTCLHYFHSETKLKNHKLDCRQMNKCKITLPEKGNNILKFTNHAKTLEVPFVIFLDTETFTAPVTTNSAPNNAYQEHKFYAVGYYLHCNYDSSLSGYREMMGPDCENWFAEELKSVGSKIQEVIFTSNLLIKLHKLFFSLINSYLFRF